MDALNESHLSGGDVRGGGAGDRLAEVGLQEQEVVEIGHAVVVEIALVEPRAGLTEAGLEGEEIVEIDLAL